MGGCQISMNKSVTNMYGSTLLALRGGGWVSNFQKKALCNTWMAPYAYHTNVLFAAGDRVPLPPRLGPALQDRPGQPVGPGLGAGLQSWTAAGRGEHRQASSEAVPGWLGGPAARLLLFRWHDDHIRQRRVSHILFSLFHDRCLFASFTTFPERGSHCVVCKRIIVN